MIVLKQNLLAFAVATAFFAVPMANLQADELPPAPSGPYAANGVQEINAGQSTADASAEGAMSELTEQVAGAAETNVAAQQAATSAVQQQAPAMPQMGMQQMMPGYPQMQGYGYPQYYRPQVQYIYVVPMMMPKMSKEQRQLMQQQMMRMYGGGQNMMQHHGNADHKHGDQMNDDVEQQETNNES